MINPLDFLRSGEAPVPLARPMPTEIRSDGGISLQLLQAPYWTGTAGNPVLAQWTWHVTFKQMFELRSWLVAPDPETGIQPEAAIKAAMEKAGIGRYLGTYVTQGMNYSEVRIILAYSQTWMPNMFTGPGNEDEARFNQIVFDVLQDGSQGGRALLHLRKLWSESPTRTDARLALLSQTDLLSELGDPDRSPYAAALLSKADPGEHLGAVTPSLTRNGGVR